MLPIVSAGTAGERPTSRETPRFGIRKAPGFPGAWGAECAPVSLKSAFLPADAHSMIFEPLPSDRGRPAGELRTLHRSLNAPVIAIDALPVGPAQAGIALGAEASGAFFVRLAIKSLRTGEVVCFAPISDPRSEDQAALTLDAGLSFAEGLGFLFDDEEAAAAVDEPERAAAAWRELVGEPSDAASHAAEDVAGAREEPPVLDLVHEIPVRLASPAPETIAIDAEDGPEPPLPSTQDPAAAMVLSKLRISLSAGAAPGETPRRRAAARNDAQDARIRLLSRF